MKRILIVGSQHGNELLGEKLYTYIKVSKPNLVPFVTYRLANHRARSRGVRYLESDMNRSYNSDLHTYEARAAHRLQADILKQNYDLVLDMHTTTVTQAACCIVPSINEAIVAFLRATSIANIVVMQHDFVRHSLIGSVPRALSVEISEQQLCDHLYEQLAQAMQCYLEGNPAPARKYVFEVDSLLAKSDVGENATLQNFTRHAEGFYPVLVGEAAYRKYTNYLGFRARTKRQVTV